MASSASDEFRITTNSASDKVKINNIHRAYALQFGPDSVGPVGERSHRFCPRVSWIFGGSQDRCLEKKQMSHRIGREVRAVNSITRNEKWNFRQRSPGTVNAATK
jgi:hypothetical protein